MDFRRILSRCMWAAAGAILLAGCHQDMWEQPRIEAQSKSQFFMDDSGSRMPVEGTVEFGKPRTDTEFYTGFTKQGTLVREFPVPVTADLVKLGRDRFDTFCRHCHGAVGDGKGMIAKRGLTMARPVATYHTQRLRDMPVGHFFDVVTNGFGVMFPLKARIEPHERWAIAAYIRVLQESQHVPVGQLPASESSRLNAMKHEPAQDAPPEPPVREKTVPLGRTPGPSNGAPGAPTQEEPGTRDGQAVPVEVGTR